MLSVQPKTMYIWFARSQLFVHWQAVLGICSVLSSQIYWRTLNWHWDGTGNRNTATEVWFPNSCALSPRYGDFLLRSRQALRGRLRAGVSGGRGVSPRGSQVQLPLHLLQEPALHLPPAAQIWQPEDLHQGACLRMKLDTEFRVVEWMLPPTQNEAHITDLTRGHSRWLSPLLCALTDWCNVSSTPG